MQLQPNQVLKLTGSAFLRSHSTGANALSRGFARNLAFAFDDRGDYVFGWLRNAGRWLIGTLPPPEFSGREPPDWVATVRTTCLPGGSVYSLRLCLWPDRASISGTTCWALLPFIRSSVPGTGELPAEQAMSLSELAKRAFAEPPPSTPLLVMDGMPCRVRLYRREPFGVMRQSWNLSAWWFPPQPLAGLPPIIQLTAELFSKSVEQSAPADRPRG